MCINDVLQEEVFNDVSKTIQESVIEDVYDKYDPTQYIRKGKMATSQVIHKEMLGNGMMKIIHKRMDGSKNVSDIVEKGIGYTWTRSKIYQSQPFPRPFMRITSMKIKSKNIHLKALKRGLKRFGLKLI